MPVLCSTHSFAHKPSIPKASLVVLLSKSECMLHVAVRIVCSLPVVRSLTVVMKGKISYTDQNIFFNQVVNMFFSAVKLGILTWGVYGIDSLLRPASSGQSMNYSLSHFRVGFKREREREGRGGVNPYLTHI